MKILTLAAFAALVGAPSVADAGQRTCSWANKGCYRECAKPIHGADNCTSYCDVAMEACMQSGTFYIQGHANEQGLKKS